MKVLIVDDNEKVRHLIREYLPGSAVDVYECSDGAEAISDFKRYEPDWVLMDQDMPGMDGITAVRQIVERFPLANICMVTAFDDQEIRDAAMAAGARSFVTKANLSELETILASGRETTSRSNITQ